MTTPVATLPIARMQPGSTESLHGEDQPRMRDTVWAGRAQKLVFDDGTPKRGGAEQILNERVFHNTKHLVLADMIKASRFLGGKERSGHSRRK